MSAELGSTTYTAVTWTTGDYITEAKMDSMVANDQAYNSHAAQGLLLNNNKSFAGITTGAANRNLIKLNSDDDIEFGDSDLAGKLKGVNGTYRNIVTADDGATVTFNLDLSNLQLVTLGGNRTLVLSNPSTGQSFILILRQDVVGGRTVTWFSGIQWNDGAAPTLATAANAYDVFVFICIGAGSYLGMPASQNAS